MLRGRNLARISAGLCASIAALLTAHPAPVSAAATLSLSTTCNAPALSQAYSWAGDINWYAPIPGVSWDAISTSGWTLAGGAKVMKTTLLDGRSGTVLDLPSGATAITPPMCVSDSYPTVRTEVRNVKGTAGVAVSIAYYGASGWGSPQDSGPISGSGAAWADPQALDLVPSTVPGWQYGRFTLTAVGSSSEYQLSNFYADPRMH